jgi:formylmethanofuran dehydrogenase subunit E
MTSPGDKKIKCTGCGAVIPKDHQTNDEKQMCRPCWEKNLTRMGWMRGGRLYGAR